MTSSIPPGISSISISCRRYLAENIRTNDNNLINLATPKEIKVESSQGISNTTEMLADADCFVSVFERFCKWCGNNYIIYSWSDNDIWQFIGECQLKGIKYSKEVRYMFNNWKDFQAEFGDMLGTERQISLTEAVTLGGLDFIGRVHDGLTDARNTAALFRQTSDKGSDEFKRLLRNLEEASRPCTYSIMEVVNFKQFDIAQ